MNARLGGYALSALLMTVLSTGVKAASVSLSANSPTATVGDLVTFSLDVDFSDEPTLGGGIDFFFDDGLLGFESFTRDPALGDEAFARREPDVLAGELNGLAFGNSGSGIGGPKHVGTLVFRALAPGSASIALAANQGGPGNPGPFVSTVTFAAQSVNFTGDSVAITPVPLPAALPLLLSAGLAVFGRRRR